MLTFIVTDETLAIRPFPKGVEVLKMKLTKKKKQFLKTLLITGLHCNCIFVENITNANMKNALKYLTAFQRNFTWFMTSMFVS